MNQDGFVLLKWGEKLDVAALGIVMEASGFSIEFGKPPSPDLFKQVEAFLGHRISGHHLAVMSLDPGSVQQSHLGQLAQPAFGACRRNLYSPTDVMAVKFPGFAVFASAGAYAAAVFLDQSKYGQPFPGECLQNHD